MENVPEMTDDEAMQEAVLVGKTLYICFALLAAAIASHFWFGWPP